MPLAKAVFLLFVPLARCGHVYELIVKMGVVA